MYPWKLKHNYNSKVDIIETVFNFNDLEKGSKIIRDSIYTDSILGKMIILGLSLKDSPEKQMFIKEISAFLDFDFKRQETGYLNKTKIAIKNHALCLHLIERCENIKNNVSYKNGKQWFHLRIAIMDICTIFDILNSDCDWCIFYGGQIHAEYIYKFLKNICNETECELSDMCKDRVSFFKALNLQNRKLSIIGEIHPETPLEFADDLLKFVSERCDIRTTTGLFLEKHPADKDDTLQQNLTCNMKDELALQKVRCTKTHCSSVKTYDVDYRHVELGFLRYEFLWPEKVDLKYAEYSRKFQEECINFMIAMCIINLHP
jgi:hypothetical protein